MLVNSSCNSRCTSCDIWQIKDSDYLDIDKISSLLSKNEFSEIEDISFSGGEPFLTKNINELAKEAIKKLPNLKYFFINHNGTMPDRLINFVQEIAPLVKYLGVSISIDGNREMHNLIRGSDIYDKTLKTLERTSEIKIPSINSIVSMTLQKLNANSYQINHVKNIANQYGAAFTFRPATKSEYYNNVDSKKFELPTREQLKEIFINVDVDDDFIKIQRDYYLQGKDPLISEYGELQCAAGKNFVTVLANGEIVPCIYSRSVLGDYKKGIFNSEFEAPCPCPPTECITYPNMIYKNDK